MYRFTLSTKLAFSQAKPNPFQRISQTLQAGGKNLSFFSLPALNDPRLERLPYSIRILLESAVRNCD